jgi:uncharacterized phiE125 gp8 family phage protein
LRRNIQIITPPTDEPVTLERAFNVLKLDISNPALTDEKLFVTDLITAARLKLERFTGRAFMTQTLKMVLSPEIKPTITGGVMTYYSENLPETIPIWRPPCQEVYSVKVIGQDLIEHTVPEGTFNVNYNAEPALIRLNFGAYWPIYIRGWYEICYEAGYGDAPGDVPKDIRHAIEVTVAQWYAQRENQDYTLPTGAVDLVDDYAIEVGDL